MHRQTGSVITNIVEYGFCTNAEDAARLKQNWKNYAESIVKAFCSFVGHKYIGLEASSGSGTSSGTGTSLSSGTSAGSDDVPKVATTQAIIIVNGKTIPLKGDVRNGITNVPVREIAEALGASVTWDQSSSTISINQIN